MKIVDLFCGAGGLSLGFEMAGFEVALGVDIEECFLKTYSKSHPNALAIKEDLSKKSLCGILSQNGIESKELIGIIGGPPCQGFSTVGNRAIDDPRNSLVREFARAIKEVRPAFFLMENVPGLATMKNGLGTLIVEEIHEFFEDLGYFVASDTLNSAHYGVPQLRRRLFFVGFRRELGLKFTFPAKTHFSKTALNIFFSSGSPYLTFSDATSDLPSIKDGEKGDNYASEPRNNYQAWCREGNPPLKNHITPKHSNLVLKRIKSIPPGGNHSNLPPELRLKSGYPNIYGRLKMDEPADTITGNFGCASAPGRFLHPIDDRVLSVREGARLQSFPDRVEFFGTLSQQYKQVGNAVPPLLAKAIAEAILRQIRAKAR